MGQNPKPQYWGIVPICPEVKHGNGLPENPLIFNLFYFDDFPSELNLHG